MGHGGDGFGLRLQGNGKTWIVSYRPVGHGRNTHARRYKLGTLQTLPSATEARRLARAVLGAVAEGRDPAAERAAMKRRERARLRDALDAYEQSLKARGYVNRKQVMSVLRRNFKPLLDRDVEQITAQQILEIPAAYEAERPGAAADFINRARGFFNWTKTKRSLISQNPLAGYRRERATRHERIKQQEYGRVLSREELASLWLEASRDHPFDRLVRFLILTGCRRSEASLFDRGWLDRNEAGPIYRIPKAVAKSGRDHDLPLTPTLSWLLDACPVMAGSSLFFPSTKTGGPMSGWSKAVKGLTKRAKIAFSLHDLRRTFRSGLDELGVESDIAELCLAHARPGLEAVYNRYDAAQEVRAAFALWHEHVERLITEEQARRQTREGDATGRSAAAA